MDISAAGGRAFGINSSDQVVGTSGDAFLYTGGMLYRLIDLINPNASWAQLSDAWGINDSGQIAGHGLHNGSLPPFLLTLQ